MTVTNPYEPTRTAGNGVKVAFDFDWKAQDTASLVVNVVDALNDKTLQVLGVDYTAVLNTVSEGGTVTMTVAPPLGEDVLIEQSTAIQQPTAFPAVGLITKEQLENEFDRRAHIENQINTKIETKFGFPVEIDTGFSPDFDYDVEAPIAGRALIYDPTARKIINSSSDFTDLDSAVAGAEAAEAAAAVSAAAALVSENSAATSENNAATSETNAASSATSSAASSFLATGQQLQDLLFWTDFTADPATDEVSSDTHSITSWTVTNTDPVSINTGNYIDAAGTSLSETFTITGSPAIVPAKGFSIATWVHLEGTSNINSDELCVARDSAVTIIGVTGVGAANRKIRALVSTTTGTEFEIPSSMANEWLLITASVHRTSLTTGLLRLYVNRYLVMEDVVGNFAGANLDDMRWRAASTSGIQRWDSMGFWNRPVTAVDLESVYFAGAGRIHSDLS